MSKITIIRSYLAARQRRFGSREELEKFQIRRLKKQLAFVRQSSPYYHDLPDVTSLRDLNNLPLIDKRLMMEHFDAINTVGLHRDEALRLAIVSEKQRKFTEKYRSISVGLSSGTSGHRGLFVVSDRERKQWAGTILARFLGPRELHGQRIAFFLRADNNLYETIDSSLLSFRYFDIYENLEKNMTDLADYNPTILVAPPSMLSIIAEWIEAGRTTLQLQKVISVAEVLEPADATRFKKTFGQQTILQIYQCTEGFLGYTCPEGTLHLNEDIAVIQKEYIGDKRFVPLITDFRRTSQPIIRYRLNDILVERDGACPCGSAMTALERIEGREGDIFTFAGLAGGTVQVFPDMVTRCMMYASGFNEFRVVQTGPDSITVFLDHQTAKIRRSIGKEFDNLAKKLAYQPPRITYKDYKRDLTKKLKRIERVF